MKAKCLNPNRAWICGTIRCKADGVISPHMVFSSNEAASYARKIGVPEALFLQQNEISVLCGKCMACQIRKRRDWTTRLTHEASFYEDNCCFITLTYDDDHVPVTCFNRLDGPMPKMLDRGVGELPLQTLLVSDVQKFMKRLRRHLEYVPKNIKERMVRDHVTTRIRYYIVGEYGSKYGRPHYHLMIFGWKPSDMTFFMMKNGHAVYRSAQIEKLWKFGFSTVEPVNGGVAKYCSRYVTKKFARLRNPDEFADSVFPEFCLQSIKGGGIGAKWFDENYEACLSKGYADVKLGRFYAKAPIPQYYWRRCRKQYLCYFLQLRDERIQLASANPCVYDYEELARSVLCYEEKERHAAQRELF